MNKGKFLYTTTIKDYKEVGTTGGTDVEFSVYGVFNTETVIWKYYAISHVPNGNGFVLTGDICQYRNAATIDSIKSYGKLFKTKEEGIAYLQEFKDKWEYGSNDTRQERREEKINDVLGGENK